MARSRLFTTLVLMGASLTGTAGIATVAATQVAGCTDGDRQNMIEVDFGAIIDMEFRDLTTIIDMALVD